MIVTLDACKVCGSTSVELMVTPTYFQKFRIKCRGCPNKTSDVRGKKKVIEEWSKMNAKK